ncbi:DUF4258 domain-containing protein [Thiothrix lacustris]|uniref:DUF4258 domain-containing protein n=1 Tax=Thiothrix lacustris TaxID=525917 RepID=A0ABY9MQ21_9GAMM|nr:DUF4258 domain-containing protein [Thiothrix lacustris]WML90677.1 DUF4258 domain-containing protein [Thiothrix lacustris]WMP17649.1 DUF4258 domain-containing protein [Thiothrix lacustris]
MISKRFNKPVILTHHATEQMAERQIDEKTLTDLIESGDVKYKDEQHLWIYKAYPNREDNMLCAAAIERNNLIIKTVMINWELSDEH